MPFSSYGLECKSRKSRNTWSNRQIWPWNKEWSRAKTNRVLPRECTGHSKYPLPTKQEKTLHMDITRQSILKSDYILCSQRWRSSTQLAKTRLGVDYVSEHELLIAKFRLKLKRWLSYIQKRRNTLVSKDKRHQESKWADFAQSLPVYCT